MAIASVTGHIGALGVPTTSEDHGLGDNVLGQDGNMWIYGQYATAIAADTVCTYTKATGVISAAAGSHTTDATGGASGEHGWVFVTAGPHG